MTPKNLSWIRSLKIPDVPDFGARLYDSIKSIGTQVTNLEQQANLNAQGEPAAPPPIQGVHVSTGPSGEFQIAITDSGNVNRGINYFAEHSTDPQFGNPHVIDMGASRNHSIYLGGQPLYWRAYSSYANSPASAPAYHGSAQSPVAVVGGRQGNRAPSMGSGTGLETVTH